MLLSSTINKDNLTDYINIASNQVTCESEIPWSFGSKLKYYLKSNVVNGLTGNIQFNSVTGLRTNLTISIVDKIGNAIDLVN